MVEIIEWVLFVCLHLLKGPSDLSKATFKGQCLQWGKTMSFSLTNPKSVRSNLADFIQSTVFAHIITVSSKVYTDRPCREHCQYSSFSKNYTRRDRQIHWWWAYQKCFEIRKNIDDIPDTVYRYIHLMIPLLCT